MSKTTEIIDKDNNGRGAMSVDLNLYMDTPLDLEPVAVSTATPTALLDASTAAMPRKGMFIQPSGAICIGGPATSLTRGIRIPADTVYYIESQHGSGWYAIAESAETTCRVVPVV